MNNPKNMYRVSTTNPLNKILDWIHSAKKCCSNTTSSTPNPTREDQKKFELLRNELTKAVGQAVPQMLWFTLTNLHSFYNELEEIAKNQSVSIKIQGQSSELVVCKGLLEEFLKKNFNGIHPLVRAIRNQFAANRRISSAPAHPLIQAQFSRILAKHQSAPSCDTILRWWSYYSTLGSKPSIRDEELRFFYPRGNSPLPKDSYHQSFDDYLDVLQKTIHAISTKSSNPSASSSYSFIQSDYDWIYLVSLYRAVLRSVTVKKRKYTKRYLSYRAKNMNHQDLQDLISFIKTMSKRDIDSFSPDDLRHLLLLLMPGISGKVLHGWWNTFSYDLIRKWRGELSSLVSNPPISVSFSDPSSWHPYCGLVQDMTRKMGPQNEFNSALSGLQNAVNKNDMVSARKHLNTLSLLPRLAGI